MSVGGKHNDQTQYGDDRNLIDGLRQNDAKSFETLVRHHGGRMLATARRITGNEDDARDCVQDAFLQVVRKIDGFEERSSLSTWLHRIVVNAALMKLRSRRRTKEISIDDLMPTFDSDDCRIEPRYPAIFDDRLEQRVEYQDAIRKAFQELPEKYVNILVLRDIHEFNTQEVAMKLGITVGAAKVRLHRARAALKKLLEPMLVNAGMKSDLASS